MEPLQSDTALHRFIEVDAGYYAIYEQTAIDKQTVIELRNVCPQAKVIVVTRYNCSDSARNIPVLTRIAEMLPQWQWAVHEDTLEARVQFGIERLPTIILYDQTDTTELGRVIENPTSGSLLHDLLFIVQKDSQL